MRDICDYWRKRAEHSKSVNYIEHPLFSRVLRFNVYVRCLVVFFFFQERRKLISNIEEVIEFLSKDMSRCFTFIESWAFILNFDKDVSQNENVRWWAREAEEETLVTVEGTTSNISAWTTNVCQ